VHIPAYSIISSLSLIISQDCGKGGFGATSIH